jgi:hypothetical protein
MALSSLTVEARGLDGIPYRVDVNSGGTNLTTSDQTPRQFLVVEGGESEDRGLNPIWPKRLRLFMLDVDLEPLFGEPDRGVPVEAYDISGSSDTLAYRGFMITDFFGDAPFAPKNIVELQALDGLGTLENDGLDQIYGESDEFATYTDAITRILGTLYPMNVEFGAQWYPSEGSLSNSDNPLASTGFNPNNYREDRPDGDWQNQLSVLKDICRSQGLVIRQAERSDGAKWHVRQRDALNPDGTIKVWEHDNSGTLVDGPKTLDRSQTISVPDGDIRQKHSRDFVRRRQTLEVTHDHTDIEDLISDSGFEDYGSGDTSSWTLTDTTEIKGTVQDRDNAGGSTVNVPGATQQNKYILTLYGLAESATPKFVAEQSLGTVDQLPPETTGNLSQLFASPSRNYTGPGLEEGIIFRLEIDGHWLTDFTTDVRGTEEVLRGSGRLPVKSLDRPIPKGARLPIQKAGEAPKSSITLSERASVGDTTLYGEISNDVKSSWQVRYAGLQSTQDYLALWRWRRNPTTFTIYDVLFSLQNGGGNQITGDINYEIGATDLYSEADDNGLEGYVDNVSLSFRQNGQPLDQTITQATVPEFGESESQKARLFSGPTDQNLARVKGDGFEPVSWGLGSGAGNLSLAELKARQRLRFWRNHNAKWTVTTADRDGSLRLTGDELVTFDGDPYTVHSIKYDPAAGETRATLIRWNDRGTSSIELETVLEQSDEQAASGGTGGTTATGGGSTVSEWDGIQNKPTGLLTRDGDADDYEGTIAPAPQDIASALNHAPGFDDEVQARVREEGSATDAALVTEQAVRETMPLTNAADYVQGTADGGEAIQAAIDALPSRGGRVFVPSDGPDTATNANSVAESGVWEVNQTIDSGTKHAVIIEGESHGWVNEKSGTALIAGTSLNRLLSLGAGFLSGARSLRIDGADQTTHGLELDNGNDYQLIGVMVHDTENCVNVANSRNVWINRCWFEKSTRGVKVSMAYNWLWMNQLLFYDNVVDIAIQTILNGVWASDLRGTGTTNEVISVQTTLDQAAFSNVMAEDVGGAAITVASGVTLRESTIRGVHVRGNDNTNYAIQNEGTLKDVDISEVKTQNLNVAPFKNIVDDPSSAPRTTIDGLGYNGPSDPANGGVWNGDGREGVLVKWGHSGQPQLAIYLNGQWYDPKESSATRLPVDSASQTEYVLLSKLDGNGNQQRFMGTLFMGGTLNSSVNDYVKVNVYYSQNDNGSNRNFQTEAAVDTESSGGEVSARPVAVDYSGTRWAAIEVSVGFGEIGPRFLVDHHTGDFDVSKVESKSASNVSNAVDWKDATEGSLARQEVRAESLIHDESRSFDFQSGWASGDGWIAAEVGPEGKPHYFEASHMVLRGTLRVRELILEQLRVRKGIQIISPGGGKLERVESVVDTSIAAGEFHNWSITDVDTSADTVTLDNSSGDLDPTATLGAGQKIAISYSTGNDGNYTIASLTDNGDGTTTVEVNETISDSTADGRLYEATVQKWYFENPDDTASAHGMAAGDRVLAQRFDPNQQQVVAQVRAVVELVYSTHEVDVTVSTNYTAPQLGQEIEGYEFAVVASAVGSRQSILADSPFQPGREVLNGLTDFDDWDNRANFLRKLSGNLDGRYDYSQAAYGLAAGPTEGEYITADSVKGVRMVDNTGGNHTVRAQLSGSALTLGATDAEHIKIDPNQSGLQFINASGTEVGRFDGPLLRLGSDGQIQFDPTQTPEARIKGTLQMSAGGVIRNANNDYRIDQDGFWVQQGGSNFSSEVAYEFGGVGDTRLWRDDQENLRIENTDGLIEVAAPGGTGYAFDVIDSQFWLYTTRSSEPNDSQASGGRLYVLDTGSQIKLMFKANQGASNEDELAAISY